MPIYEYCCEECRHIFEEWQKDFVERDMTCPICGGQAKRLISNTAFILKGSGWYVTDYARNSSSAGDGNGKGAKENASLNSEKSEKSEKETSKTESKDSNNAQNVASNTASSSSTSSTSSSTSAPSESK